MISIAFELSSCRWCGTQWTWEFNLEK